MITDATFFTNEEATYFKKGGSKSPINIADKKTISIPIERNERRFPPDFMFRLTKKEKGELVTNCDRFERLKHSSKKDFLDKIYRISWISLRFFTLSGLSR